MADAPYGYVVVHEPMANEGLTLGRGVEANGRRNMAPFTLADAEAHAARARVRSPESRFVVCVLVPIEAGIQQSLDMLDTEAL